MSDNAMLAFNDVIADIASMPWHQVDEYELTRVAWAYYYFSIQFRENLVIARGLHPEDAKLRQLEEEECDTSNLSPWHGVAEAGERMNHDEFMRRTLLLSPIDEADEAKLKSRGQRYLDTVRGMNVAARALSIASYEDGGLERVFRAFLGARSWGTPLLQAFQHFLTKHIVFDSDPDGGHGALSRHLRLDDRILPLWVAFRDILVEVVPRLSTDVTQPGKVEVPETVI